MIRAFALVIAINEVWFFTYSSSRLSSLQYCHAPLYGCLKDADRMCSFLKRKYGSSLILKVLKDSEATKDEILKALKEHFLNNNQISRGDAMIIYFAGHGSQIQIQTQKIEVLCPFDYDHTKDVTGIKDIDFRRRLEELAETKGDNIVEILFMLILSTHAFLDGYPRLLSLRGSD